MEKRLEILPNKNDIKMKNEREEILEDLPPIAAVAALFRPNMSQEQEYGDVRAGVAEVSP